MTPLQLAELFNVASIALVLAITLSARRDFERRFFRYWLLAHAWELVAALGEALAVSLGRPAWAVGLVALGCSVASVYLVLTAWDLRGRAGLPRGWIALAVGSLAFAVLAPAFGAAYPAPVVPAILLATGGLIYLGLAFLRVGTPSLAFNVMWLALPLLARGSVLFWYPLAAQHGLLWLGATISTLMHVIAGFGMLLYLARTTLDELRAKNDELAEQHEALQRLDRLKDDFIAVIGHEVRTPLTAIRGGAQLLQEPGLPAVMQAESVALVERSAFRLAGLIEMLFDYQRLRHGMLTLDRRSQPLMPLLEATAAEMADDFAAKGVALETSLVPVDAPVDAARLQQAVRCLMDNALKFTPTDGCVSLSLRREGEMALIVLADTGVGISADQHARIWERLYQVDGTRTRPASGVGLGLAVVKAIADGHDGRVDVASKLGRGATFTLRLPC